MPLDIAGKKKSASPSDDNKVKLAHPDHIRVLIGDLSDGVAGTGDSDEDMSEAEEEEEEEGSEVCNSPAFFNTERKLIQE